MYNCRSCCYFVVLVAVEGLRIIKFLEGVIMWKRNKNYSEMFRFIYKGE